MRRVATISIPTVEEIQALFAEGEREITFRRECYRDLMLSHPDQFVAAYQGRIIAASPTLDWLRQELDRHGLTRSDVWLTYVFSTQPKFAL